MGFWRLRDKVEKNKYTGLLFYTVEHKGKHEKSNDIVIFEVEKTLPGKSRNYET